MPIILTLLIIKMLSKTSIICKSYVKTGTLISYNSLINDQYLINQKIHTKNIKCENVIQ